MAFEVRPGSKSIFGKIRAVMEAIDHIEKAGRNTQQAYDYVKAEDVFDEVRQEFIKNGLVVLSACVGARLIEGATKSGTVTYLTETDMEYTLCDVDTGDTITVPWKGQGQDSGDKGIYKAFTGAGKTFFKALAMIPAGDDPEKDDESPKGAKPGQQQRPPQAPSRPAPPPPRPANAAPLSPPGPKVTPPTATTEGDTDKFNTTGGVPPTEAECATLLDGSKGHKGGGKAVMETLFGRGMAKPEGSDQDKRRMVVANLLAFTRNEFDALTKKVAALPPEPPKEG